MKTTIIQKKMQTTVIAIHLSKPPWWIYVTRKQKKNENNYSAADWVGGTAVGVKMCDDKAPGGAIGNVLWCCNAYQFNHDWQQLRRYSAFLSISSHVSLIHEKLNGNQRRPDQLPNIFSRITGTGYRPWTYFISLACALRSLAVNFISSVSFLGQSPLNK